MDIPTFAEVSRIAPMSVVILILIYAGYYTGRTSQNGLIQVLKDWIDHLKGK